MRYIIQQGTALDGQFATNLRTVANKKRLIWASSPEQDVLIVQTRFGTNALDSFDEICFALNNVDLPSNRFIQLVSMSDTWVRYVRFSDSISDDGCALHEKSCSYTVFCCKVNDSELIIYKQDSGRVGNLPYCDVCLEIPIQVHKLTYTVKRLFGLLGEHEIDTGYYQITLPKERVSDLCDDDLYYTLAGYEQLEIPLNKSMIQNGVVYVKSDSKPIVSTHNKGLQVKQS